MTKVLGLFAIKYSTFSNLPWEIQSMIVNYLRSSQLEYILSKYPDKLWNWKILSEHPNITMEVIGEISK